MIAAISEFLFYLGLFIFYLPLILFADYLYRQISFQLSTYPEQKFQALIESGTYYNQVKDLLWNDNYLPEAKAIA